MDRRGKKQNIWLFGDWRWNLERSFEHQISTAIILRHDYNYSKIRTHLK